MLGNHSFCRHSHFTNHCTVCKPLYFFKCFDPSLGVEHFPYEGRDPSSLLDCEVDRSPGRQAAGLSLHWQSNSSLISIPPAPLETSIPHHQ